MALAWHNIPLRAVRDIHKPARVWKGITLHHTATRHNGKHQAGAIDAWHRFSRGWLHGLGYHFLIEEDGAIAVGNRWRQQLAGAHEKGFNSTHIGIGLVGWFDRGKDIPTPYQLWSLIRLIRILRNELGWPGDLMPPAGEMAIVRYHSDSTTKTCPGEIWQGHKLDLIAAIAAPDPAAGVKNLASVLTEEAWER